MKTKDGYTISTVEQDGHYAGEELGRVFVLRENGYDWFSFEPEEIESAVRTFETLTLAEIREQF